MDYPFACCSVKNLATKGLKHFYENNCYLTLWGTLITCINISMRNILWIIFRFVKCVAI